MAADWYEVVATGVTSAAGALGGAFYAFKLSAQEKVREREDRQAAAANQALFVLGLQMNLMVNMRKQHLDEFREHPVRHVALRAFQPIDRTDLHLNLQSLEFLLATSSKDTLLLLMLADDWFHTMLGIQNERCKRHDRAVQPLIEQAVLQLKQPEFSLEQIDQILGPRLTAQMRQLTDSLYEFVDDGCKKHQTLGLRFAQEMRAILPKHSFLYMNLPAA